MKKTIILSIALALIGLNSIAQWGKCPTCENYRLRGVFFVDANIGYAVGDDELILKTVDAGMNWSVQNSNPGSNLYLNSVYFINASIGYAVGGIGLKTIDGGLTWQSFLSSGNFSSVFFTDANNGYMTSFGGSIYKTINGGTTWTSQWIKNDRLLSVFFTDANTGYVTGGSGTILKTINGGITWTAQNSGTYADLCSIFFTDANTGYVVGSPETIAGTNLKTTNGGTTWTIQNNGASFYLYSVFFTDANNGCAVGTGGYFVKTSNGGLTWSVENSRAHNDLKSVYFTSVNIGYAVGDYGTLLKTIDGGTTWTSMYGITHNRLNSVQFPTFNTGYAIGEFGTVVKTTDGGATWSIPYSFPDNINLNSVYFTDAITGYAVGSSGKTFKTDNGGFQWIQSTPVTSKDLLSVYFPVAGTGYAVGKVGAILKTVNSGSTWSLLSPPTSLQLNSVYFSDVNRGYIVCNNGLILKTTDGGIGWSPKPSGVTNNLNSVYFPSVNNGYVVGSNGSILKTTDGGDTWSPVQSGMTKELYSVYFADDNLGYTVGTGGTIIKTSDGGTTWRSQISETTEDLFSVYFTNASTGFAVGDHGMMCLTTNGGEIVPPTLSTAAPYAITATTAISGGDITSNGGGPVIARGVCVALWENPDLTDGPTMDGTGSGAFVSNISGLWPATNYHVRAYATNSGGTAYGNDIAFTTPCPTSFSLPFSQVFGTTDQPACWTQVDHQGTGQVWQFGVISGGWDPLPNLDYNYAYLNSGAYGSGGNQNADLITPLLDLSGYASVTLGFSHFFKSSFGTSGKISYSTNNGTSWTTLQTFTSTSANPALFSMSIPGAAGQSQVKFKWNYTGGNGYYWAIDDVQITGLPFVNTTAPSSITTSTAVAGGTINPGGGATFTARGVCWGETANPDITGNHTTNGSGTGTFVINLTGLSHSTTYHIRAYGTKSGGTSYGNDLSFTTLCGSVSLPYYEGFANATIPNCWSQTDIQGYGQRWQFGVIPGSPYNPGPALTGNYAYLNSDGYGNGNTQDVTLVSPVFDLSSYSTVVLGFNHYFRGFPGSNGTLFYSINNGSWNGIANFEYTTNPEPFSRSIPEVAGQSQVRFGWNYFGTYGYYWAIDDITVSEVATNRALTNLTVGPGATPCYNAQQTITVAGSGTTFTVQNGGDATLVAGQNISFLPGTKVDQGGHLWGYITTTGSYCVAPSAPFNTLNTDEPAALIQKESSLFRVYPNPTTGKFTLELNTELNDVEATVRIYGMLGEEVLQENLAGSRKTEFSLSERPNGIYIIRVMMGDKMGTAKVIKQE
ncbi:MAG: YCF48-related protein [Bacteroidota bacterium]